jgi:hypothetical protein
MVRCGINGLRSAIRLSCVLFGQAWRRTFHESSMKTAKIPEGCTDPYLHPTPHEMATFDFRGELLHAEMHESDPGLREADTN